MPFDLGRRLVSPCLKCFTEVTRHSPSGNVDIKFPALCKHSSRNGINKGDPFPRARQKGPSRGRTTKKTDLLGRGELAISPAVHGEGRAH